MYAMPHAKGASNYKLEDDNLSCICAGTYI